MTYYTIIIYSWRDFCELRNPCLNRKKSRQKIKVTKNKTLTRNTFNILSYFNLFFLLIICLTPNPHYITFYDSRLHYPQSKTTTQPKGDCDHNQKNVLCLNLNLSLKRQLRRKAIATSLRLLYAFQYYY